MTLPNPPSSPKAEAAAAMIKVVVSTIPYVGGILTEVGNLYLNPLEQRKQAWLQEVAQAIQVIQSRFNSLPEELQSNERFVSFLYQATIIALKNHRNEKLTALRHALISVADPLLASEDLAFQFLRYVDELTPTHLKILKSLSVNLDKFARADSLELVISLLETISNFGIDRLAIRLFIKDLDTRFLIDVGDIDELPEFASKVTSITMTDSGKRTLQVTELGREFLKFIDEEAMK